MEKKKSALNMNLFKIVMIFIIILMLSEQGVSV